MEQTVPGHSHWAGSPQSYLCATGTVLCETNFAEPKKNGIRLLTVHNLRCLYVQRGRRVRKSGACDDEKRLLYVPRKLLLLAAITGVLSSSRRVSDWAVPYLVFCRMRRMVLCCGRQNHRKRGIPVPLFNLVYHDCVIERG